MIKTSIGLLALAIGALASPLRCRDESLTLEAEDGTLSANDVLTEFADFTGPSDFHPRPDPHTDSSQAPATSAVSRTPPPA